MSFQIPRICPISLSASSFVANAVCPSFHKNSLVLRKGAGCLNSHLTTEFHWLSLSGKSLHERIHFEYESYIIASDVGLTASLSPSFVWPPSVTQATSGVNPLT